MFVSLNNPLLQAVLTKGYCEWMGFCFGHQPPNSLLQFSHWKGITRNWLHIIKEQRLALPLSSSESCCFCKTQQRLIHGQFLVIIVSLWWPFCVVLKQRYIKDTHILMHYKSSRGHRNWGRKEKNNTQWFFSFYLFILNKI